MRTLLLSIPFALALAAPAAALECSDTGFRIGGNVVITTGIHFGAPFTEAEIAEFDKMRLRADGVDVTRAERWAGCVRAWVRQPDGTEKQQFFDPNSYEKLDLTLQ
jgi:hypothetical protein